MNGASPVEDVKRFAHEHDGHHENTGHHQKLLEAALARVHEHLVVQFCTREPLTHPTNMPNL